MGTSRQFHGINTGWFRWSAPLWGCVVVWLLRLWWACCPNEGGGPPPLCLLSMSRLAGAGLLPGSCAASCRSPAGCCCLWWPACLAWLLRPLVASGVASGCRPASGCHWLGVARYGWAAGSILWCLWCGGRRPGRVVGWACRGRRPRSVGWSPRSSCLPALSARCESLGVGLPCALARAPLCEGLGVVLDVMGGWVDRGKQLTIDCLRSTLAGLLLLLACRASAAAGLRSVVARLWCCARLARSRLIGSDALRSSGCCGLPRGACLLCPACPGSASLARPRAPRLVASGGWGGTDVSIKS